jgi:hypothetical protein
LVGDDDEATKREIFFFNEENSHKTPNSPLHTMVGHTAYIPNNVSSFFLGSNAA